LRLVDEDECVVVPPHRTNFRHRNLQLISCPTT